MKAEDTVNRIRGALGDHLAGFELKSDNRVYIEVRPETVIEASELMIGLQATRTGYLRIKRHSLMPLARAVST